MSWAQEMKNLSAGIKTSHQDRTQFIKGNVREVKNFLTESEEKRRKDFDVLLKDIQTKVKAIKSDVKHHLAKSKEDRLKIFDELIKNIRAEIKVIKARVKEIKGDTSNLLSRYDKEMKELASDLKESAAHLKTFLKENEEKRMVDFKEMMKDIATVIGDIVADVKTIRKSTSHLMANYQTERKEAAGYWAGLNGKTKAHQVKKDQE